MYIKLLYTNFYDFCTGHFYSKKFWYMMVIFVHENILNVLK